MSSWLCHISRDSVWPPGWLGRLLVYQEAWEGAGRGARGEKWAGEGTVHDRMLVDYRKNRHLPQFKLAGSQAKQMLDADLVTRMLRGGGAIYKKDLMVKCDFSNVVGR